MEIEEELEEIYEESPRTKEDGKDKSTGTSPSQVGSSQVAKGTNRLRFGA